MKIALASDHGGFELKEQLKRILIACDYEVEDLGTQENASVDYPAYGVKCAKYVAAGLADKGIVFCGTGIGISIAANKIKGIRCALVTNRVEAEFAAAHNHANMLAFGGRTTTAEAAAEYTQIWLTTPEDYAERHVRRVEMLNAL